MYEDRNGDEHLGMNVQSDDENRLVCGFFWVPNNALSQHRRLVIRSCEHTSADFRKFSSLHSPLSPHRSVLMESSWNVWVE